MIVKTDRMDKKTGKYFYKNVFTGEEGFLGHIRVEPSMRRENRQRPKPIQKVTSNRKSTKGRRIIYQTLPPVYKTVNGKQVMVRKERVIKHYQYTSNAIQEKNLVLGFFDRIKGMVQSYKKPKKDAGAMTENNFKSIR